LKLADGGEQRDKAVEDCKTAVDAAGSALEVAKNKFADVDNEREQLG
jgi:hypothetical protein